jgi:hypothetical protein
MGLDGGVRYGIFEGAFFRPIVASDGRGGILSAQRCYDARFPVEIGGSLGRDASSRVDDMMHDDMHRS